MFFKDLIVIILECFGGVLSPKFKAYLYINSRLTSGSGSDGTPFLLANFRLFCSVRQQRHLSSSVELTSHCHTGVVPAQQVLGLLWEGVSSYLMPNGLTASFLAYTWGRWLQIWFGRLMPCILHCKKKTRAHHTSITYTHNHTGMLTLTHIHKYNPGSNRCMLT